jgi:hypothetical protein
MEPNEEQRRAYARYLGSLPKGRQERRCIVCGKRFQGTMRAEYCSNACRQRAKYRRARGLSVANEPS